MYRIQRRFRIGFCFNFDTFSFQFSIVCCRALANPLLNLTCWEPFLKNFSMLVLNNCWPLKNRNDSVKQVLNDSHLVYSNNWFVCMKSSLARVWAALIYLLSLTVLWPGRFDLRSGNQKRGRSKKVTILEGN